MNDVDYRILVKGKVKSFHANMLKLYVERQTGMGCLDVVAVSAIDDDETDVHDVVMTHPGATRSETYKDVKTGDKLNDRQLGQIKQILKEFDDVLSDLPGRTDVIEHDVELTTSEPIRSKGYKIPFKTKEIIQTEVQTMLDLGVIERSKSPYSSPIVLVSKKDGTVRFCIDFRKINKATVFDSEPMPELEGVFASMSGCTYFSKIDLTKGYWQIPLTDSARELTAFETPLGLFQYTVMPFGMVNSGATFCRMMRQVLGAVDNVNSFVDDVWMFTSDWESHLRTVREVFTRLRQAGLTVKPSKCLFGTDKVECLGHTISGKGLEPNQEKIQSIVGAERPTTKKQIRSFLGMVGFYRRFIPRFSAIASPLTDLTKKGCPNKIKDWSHECEAAFELLKQSVTNAPVLALPNFDKQFILQTDASANGIGSVLLQGDISDRSPVAYASKKLGNAQRNYSVIERECFAIVWAVEKFHRYLYGTEFIIEVDHEPLSYLQSAKTLNSRLMRWALRLQPYRFRIVHIRGSDNVCADYLSRQ